MNLTLADTKKPSGYLPIRAGKIKSHPGAPVVNKGRPRAAEPEPEALEVLPPLPKSFRCGKPVWHETDAKHAVQSAPVEGETEEEAEGKAKYRRLRNLPRAVQRPLESRLYHLRRVYHWSDKRIAKALDLHPADLNALAATAGQL